jgi:hypothetical protein
LSPASSENASPMWHIRHRGEPDMAVTRLFHLSLCQ